MVNLTLEARVRYPLYIIIYCKRVQYTADSLVWGSLRLAPIMCTKQSVYLHVFADASMKTYGAIAYLQSAEKVDLVMAKSRVSPLKDTTLPRLELRAAVTAAHLAKFIVSTLQPQLGDVNIRL